MAGQFGISFTPTDQNLAAERAKKAETPLQDAIKILNLRVPSFSGARSPIPSLLLNSQGSAGLAGMAGFPGGIEAMLRRIFGTSFGLPAGSGAPSGPARGPGGPVSTAPPPPHVGPGSESDTDWQNIPRTDPAPPQAPPRNPFGNGPRQQF